MRRAALGLTICLCACSPKPRKPESSGAYVQDVTTRSAIVAMVTALPTELRLRYGEVAPLEESVEDAEPVTNHGLEATALAPKTRYLYRLETRQGQVLAEGSFQTAPADPSAACTFLVVGDTGGTDKTYGEPLDAGRRALDETRGATDNVNQQSKVVAAMLTVEADLVLHTGDVVYPAGAREDYSEAFFKPFAPLIARVPIYPTLGNHDLKTEGGRPFLETFFLPRGGPTEDERVYSFDWGCVHFVCLDVGSTPFAPGSPQLTWLADDLARSNARWKVAYFHVPPFPVCKASPKELQDVLVPALEEGGVDLVFSGHNHAYGRLLPRGRTTYVVSGGGGKSLYKVRHDADIAYAESVFHFVEVKATYEELNLRAIDAGGLPFDQVTIRK